MVMLKLLEALHLVRDPDKYGWIMLLAQAMKAAWRNALIQDGEITIAHMAMTRVLCVQMVSNIHVTGIGTFCITSAKGSAYAIKPSILMTLRASFH